MELFGGISKLPQGFVEIERDCEWLAVQENVRSLAPKHTKRHRILDYRPGQHEPSHSGFQPCGLC
jgi:hypothetical protein